jgi:hypothetical protein
VLDKMHLQQHSPEIRAFLSHSFHEMELRRTEQGWSILLQAHVPSSPHNIATSALHICMTYAQ